MYLVAGGKAGSTYLASTELLVHGASAWTKAGPLPQAIYGLQAVSLVNKVISTGEFISNHMLDMWLIVTCNPIQEEKQTVLATTWPLLSSLTPPP